MDGTATRRSPALRLWNTPVGADLGFLLARANAISLSATHAALEPYGLKVRSYTVLALVVTDLHPTQRELSSFLRLDPSQIVSLVDDLEQAGLVRREPDIRDRRANVVVPTSAGRDRHAQAHAAATEAEAKCFDRFSADDLARLQTMLRTLADAPEAGAAG